MTVSAQSKQMPSCLCVSPSAGSQRISMDVSVTRPSHTRLGDATPAHTHVDTNDIRITHTHTHTLTHTYAPHTHAWGMPDLHTTHVDTNYICTTHTHTHTHTHIYIDCRTLTSIEANAGKM